MIFLLECTNQGRIQDFKLGGGGRTLKNCSERREARNFLGYFVWKITILRQKIIFFPIVGLRAPGAPPPSPGSVPANAFLLSHLHFTLPWRRWLPVEWMLADVTSTPVFTVFYFTFVNRFFNRAHRLTFAQQYLCNGFQLQINSIDVDRYMYSIYTTVNAV
jgi:hypothetical protein